MYEDSKRLAQQRTRSKRLNTALGQLRIKIDAQEIKRADDVRSAMEAMQAKAKAKALTDSLQAEAELMAMLNDAPKVAQTAEEAERSRKKKEKRQRQQQQKKLQKAMTPAKEPSALLLESVLQDLNLTALAAPLASLGLDNQSIAQADDDDWEDLEIDIAQGRLLRRTMRQKLGY